MITVIYRLGKSSHPSEATVANDDDLLDLINIFERSDALISYMIVDTSMSDFNVESLSVYGCIPEGFPKFRTKEKF